MKELLSTNSTLNTEEIPAAEYDLNINTNDFTFEEISKAFKSTKTGKSPGNDPNVTAEALKHRGNKLIEHLRQIFNVVLHSEEAPMQWKKAIVIPIPKKSSKSMSNFRGISLMSIDAKVFNRVILNRIYEEVLPRLRPFQVRFRRGKSCTKQIHIIRRILEQYHQKNIPIIMAFIDLEKAFDPVNRDTIWKILRNYGVPEKIVNIIKCLYDGSISAVRVDGILSKEFLVTTGDFQGDTLAPFLFIIILDFVTQKTETTRGLKTHPAELLPDLEFADDTVKMKQRL